MNSQVNQHKNIKSDEDEPMDVDTSSEMLQASYTLHQVYAKSIVPEVELSSAEMQAAVCNNYGKLQLLITFKILSKKECKRQSTLTVFKIIKLYLNVNGTDHYFRLIVKF